jgi:transcriptional regulator with XRE-family HTH domain
VSTVCLQLVRQKQTVYESFWGHFFFMVSFDSSHLKESKRSFLLASFLNKEQKFYSKGETFMQLLKKLRLEKNLSLRKLASSIGKSPAFLSEIERGTRNPSPDTLASLASVLGHHEELFLATGLLPSEIKIALTDTSVYRFLSRLSLLDKNTRDSFLLTANKLL